MPNYQVLAVLAADAGTDIEASSVEEALEKAEAGGIDALEPTLCHQCSEQLNLDDPIGFVVSNEDASEVLSTAPQDKLREELEAANARCEQLTQRIIDLESDLEEPAHMQADAYRQAVDKIHPYVEAGRLPASLDASLVRLLKAFDRLEDPET